jgi:hypothetical protein
MTNEDGTSGIGRKASVTVEAAAKLADIDEATIRHWSEIGALTIESRGDMEVVRLDRVHWLSQAPHVATRVSRNAALKDRLGEATTETLDVTDLQELARDREPGSLK